MWFLQGVDKYLEMHSLKSVEQVKYMGIKISSKLKLPWENIALSYPVLPLSQVSTSGARTSTFFSSD